ncbi:KGGVGR-motif variant AAA ATPase [Pseudomonas aeruginosa]|nr:AAA family ATPase [Pseudomonas aeruginosa]MBI8409911.1 AAA family ATPase [Pseudomonas aeruginosa]HBO3409192.1 AAA family ATPase [Pseudomonas aeruginosa]HCF3087267.1 AAA family ATPase [Pseudomonas aeruginosa]HEJ5778826.1 AAA family ATPase [Pseudomonas aeruginosa]
MSLQTNTAERLLTWLDVERVLKQRSALWTQLPKNVLSVDCFANGLEVRHVADDDLVDDWLSQIFGHAYQRDQRFIHLRIGEACYPVELMRESESVESISGQNYPLWRDVTYLPIDEAVSEPLGTQPLIRPMVKTPMVWTQGPDLVSFHSFKGGVGRTTALMTYVAACIQESGSAPKKILVVDADLEAPGVSFWLDKANQPKVSFVQLLEALHYPPAGLDATLNFFAQELRKTSLNVGGLQRELFVLPAALNLTEIQDMPVTPEHLARNPDNPWQLSDHLHALGQHLGVDAVFIDLRAGLSELASPILFDPRVDHFFVSTVAPQSVQGMAEVLRRLYAFNRQLPAAQQEDARPTIVLSLLTKELRDAEHYELALKALGEAYPTDDALTPGVQWLEAEFLSTLMSIGSVREALDSLPQSSRLFASASEWAKALYAEPVPTLPATSTGDASPAASSRHEQAKRLYEVCRDAEFADSGATSAILATEPLLNLGKHYANELPNLLMIGAKGAGKTFTFRQLVGAGTWQHFLNKLGFDPANTTDAAIFPALWSDNIEDKPDGEIKLVQSRTLDLIQGDKHLLFGASAVRRLIEDALRSPPDHWEDFWDSLLACQFGISHGGLPAVNQALVEHSTRLIFVFDGIEDAFRDANSSHVTEAIHALLRLPNRVSELENRHVGVIVFVRADYVQATIRQNLGQWLQRFQPFRLLWNPESFLRLAFMLSCQAGIHPNNPKSAESLRIEELKNELERLWGKKLGSEKSKEAHSARWVYAALCDLKGNVQARDLVRFLKFAATVESTRTGQTWPDRLLAPESMRKAIPDCSIEKVTEAKSEIAPLRRWMDLMEDRGVRNLKVPFSLEQAQLDAALLGSLQELGVIYEDVDGNLGEERLFLPEIYRYGLGFVTSAAGRPRTQALLKKNIGAIPL